MRVVGQDWPGSTASDAPSARSQRPTTRAAARGGFPGGQRGGRGAQSAPPGDSGLRRVRSASQARFHQQLLAPLAASLNVRGSHFNDCCAPWPLVNWRFRGYDGVSGATHIRESGPRWHLRNTVQMTEQGVTKIADTITPRFR